MASWPCPFSMGLPGENEARLLLPRVIEKQSLLYLKKVKNSRTARASL